ncbi:MAG: hypothetical protein K6U12_01520 [Armatimonadetes bacterium]|nr:hypothetical protein [Armatimonadota bacterium]
MMEIRTHARVMNQRLVPLEPLDLPEGAEVQLCIQLPDASEGEAALVNKEGLLVVHMQTPVIDRLIETIRAERLASTLEPSEK